MFAPVHTIGNKDRVRKKGEPDGDADRLSDLNKTWREMLRDDPWRKNYMTHVSFLINVAGVLFLIFFLSGLVLPAKHWIFTVILTLNVATLPWWIWIGIWRRRTYEKLLAVFKKKFGKHFHLK